MNVYDFDGTIYEGDSAIDFYFYCLVKNPNIICNIPKQFQGFILYLLKKIDKTQMKEYFYSYFPKVYNIDEVVEQFWKNRTKKIKKWYLDEHQANDVIISASPHFLLSFICEKLEVEKLIASNVDKKTGKYQGRNCKGEEKVARFEIEYPNAKINKFYSDSCSDLPIAQLAEEAYLVRKNRIEKWERTSKS